MAQYAQIWPITYEQPMLGEARHFRACPMEYDSRLRIITIALVTNKERAQLRHLDASSHAEQVFAELGYDFTRRVMTPQPPASMPSEYSFTVGINNKIYWRCWISNPSNIAVGVAASGRCQVSVRKS